MIILGSNERQQKAELQRQQTSRATIYEPMITIIGTSIPVR